MKRSKFSIQVFTLLIVVVTFFIGLPSQNIAQKQTATLSGRVVDIEGNPVAELPVFVSLVEMLGSDAFRPVFFPDDYFDSRRTLTNSDGRFTITKIPSGPICFNTSPHNISPILPDSFEPDFEILSLHSQGTTVYPHSDFQQIVFGIKPGTHTTNVVVTVQPRMRIRGRVLFKDGTPLTNGQFRLGLTYDTEDGKGHGSSGGRLKTDTDGYFVYYLKEKDDSAIYTFSVRYMGLIAKSDPVLLNPGERLDGLTFTFNSDPIAPKPPRKTKRIAKKPDPPPAQEHPIRQKPEEVWIINPANRHAYKRVHCKTRDDAIAQAIKEKAHLVTINDAKEQAWLERVFGYSFYWIGLSNTETAGKWQWDNGEPLTYQNWLPNDYFSESSDVNERNYAVTTFANGKWSAVSSKSVIVKMTKMAIIEKADVEIKQSRKKK